MGRGLEYAVLVKMRYSSQIKIGGRWGEVNLPLAKVIRYPKFITQTTISYINIVCQLIHACTIDSLSMFMKINFLQYG